MSRSKSRRGSTNDGSTDSTRDASAPVSSGTDDGAQPPEIARGSRGDHHHEVVMPVRDITAPRTPEVSVPMGADTAIRIAFPVTYDIVLDQPHGIVLDEPKDTETGEDDS